MATTGNFMRKNLENQGAYYYICKSNSTKTMDISKSFGQSYLSPATQIIEIDTEGILCASGDTPTETLGENLGSWN